MIRNLAILAHVDAGKTTLSERILFMAGEIRYPGNVDDGLATLDYLPEERAKGITIEAGMSSFRWKEQQFNLVDTPGHIDFGAEVDLALESVEGAVLVVSGISGVETQTVSAWRKLREKGILTVLFINKLDHPDARLDDVLLDLEERLEVRPLLLNLPDTSSSTGRMLDVITLSSVDQDSQGRELVVEKMASPPESLLRLRQETMEAASAADDRILSLLLEGKTVPAPLLVEGLRALFQQGEYAPCYCGSALLCRGIRQLMTSFGLFFSETPSEESDLLGTVVRLRHDREGREYALLKVERDLPKAQWPLGFEFLRIFAECMEPVEEIRSRDILALRTQRSTLALGARLNLQGDVCGESPSIARLRSEAYRPLLHTRIECVEPTDWDRVDAGLQVIQRSDPSIQVQREVSAGGWILKTVGEVQLEVLLSRLQRELHCPVHSGPPEVVRFECLRHPLPVRSSDFHAPDGAYLRVALSLEPVLGHRRVQLEFRCPSAPSPESKGYAAALAAFQEFAEQGVCGSGALRGVLVIVSEWEAPEDCPAPWIKKICTDSIRLLLRPEDVEILEPIMSMEMECAQDYAGNLIGDLQGRGGKIKEFGGDGRNAKILLEIPLQNVFGYSTIGRSISKGTASYALRYVGHRSLQT
ncbi:MAG TPA: GTP-binding protein [Fibrobacteraceae bacterium]|nr:GTP-binding protein [Fibrobacteraceae bacterium]